MLLITQLQRPIVPSRDQVVTSIAIFRIELVCLLQISERPAGFVLPQQARAPVVVNAGHQVGVAQHARGRRPCGGVALRSVGRSFPRLVAGGSVHASGGRGLHIDGVVELQATVDVPGAGDRDGWQVKFTAETEEQDC